MHTQGTPEWVDTRDGRQLYAQVLDGPADAPVTVVFEAGYAAQRSTWAPVQVRVAEFARAVVYDRSGLGRSAPDPRGRSIARMADDLGDVLAHFGPGPFILVGHSAGGPIVRAAASRHRRHQIRGAVLVDPSDEAADFALSRQMDLLQRVVEPVELVLARTGLFKPLFRGLLGSIPYDDVRDDLDREGFTPQVVHTQMQQTKTFLDELRAWRTMPPQLGDLPVTVISGAKAGNGMSAGQRAAFNRAHETRAASFTRGRHVLAPASAHFVPLTDAELIANEIARLV